MREADTMQSIGDVTAGIVEDIRIKREQAEYAARMALRDLADTCPLSEARAFILGELEILERAEQ